MQIALRCQRNIVSVKDWKVGFVIIHIQQWYCHLVTISNDSSFPLFIISCIFVFSVGCTQIAPQGSDMRPNNMSFVFTLVPVISANDALNKRMELSIVRRECGHTAGGSLRWKGDHTQTGVWQGVANGGRFHLLQKFSNPETFKIL